MSVKRRERKGSVSDSGVHRRGENYMLTVSGVGIVVDLKRRRRERKEQNESEFRRVDPFLLDLVSSLFDSSSAQGTTQPKKRRATYHVDTSQKDGL